MDQLSAEDQSFLEDLRQNALLEREEAYHKINLELEKKTSAIIEKIEQYSAARKAKQRNTRARSLKSSSEIVDLTGSGDGDNLRLNNSEEISARSARYCDPSSPNAVGNKCSSYDLITLFEESDRDLRRASSAVSTGSVPSLATTKRTNGSHRLKDTALSSSGTLLSSSGASDFPGFTGTELRQQSRLQKATESVVNCLQSKLTNYETRLTELHLQHRQKIQENTMLESKVRALEEERERLLRSVTSLQNSLDRQNKTLENTKNNASSKSQVVESMKKEIESLKREQKQSKAQVQSLQTRLNRTSEENEKLKSQNKSLNLHLREIQTENRTKLEEQSQRINNLEQERGLLSSTVAKQAHLLKNLTQQKRLSHNSDKVSKLFS